METYLVMLLAVVFCHLLALCTHILLEGWIYDEFFSNRMTSKLPSELVSESLLMIVIV